MSDINGTFHHNSDGDQVLNDVVITQSTCNGVTVLTGAVIPTSAVESVKGSLYVCTLADNIGLYINTGTVESPTWVLLNLIDSGNAFLTFSLPNEVGTAVINQTAHTVDLVIAGSLSSLAATFTVSQDATVKVGETSQTSGVTTNTFSAPVTYTITSEGGTAQDWVVTAALETYDLSRTATNGTVVVTVEATPVDDGTGVLTYGDSATITATPTEGYSSYSLLVNGEAFTSGESLTVIDDVDIVYEAIQSDYTVTNTLTNITSDGGATATYNTNYTATLTATSGSLPETITVSIGGTEVTQDVEYTWNSATGALVITGSYITGNIIITASAVI